MNNDIRLIFERYSEILNEAQYGEGTMSVEQLREYLESINSPTPVSIDKENVLKIPNDMLAKNRETKEPNPYVGLIKKSTISGMAGNDVEIGILNRELKAHADDPNYRTQTTVGPLWGGKGRFISALLRQHIDSGKYYLAIGDVQHGESEYIFNGQIIDKQDLLPYLKKQYDSAKQTAVGITPENQLRVNNVWLGNIKKIRIKGFEITVA